MAFARPSSAAVLGFLCIKLHTTDSLEQVVHEDQTAEHRRERTSTPKTTRHTSPQERTRTDKHLNKNSPRQKVQEEFKPVQVVKTTSNQVPRTCNKQTCYDPQLQGYLIWQCHLSDPFTATSLDHLHTLVQQELQQRSSNLQKRSRQVQHVAKPSQNRTVKTVNKLNCKTMTTVKTVAYIVQ